MISALAIVAEVAQAAFTPLLIAMLAIIAIAAIVAGIVAAFQQHDRALEHSIESLKEEVEDLDNAITNINNASKRMVGLEKMRNELDATSKSMSKATAYAEMLRLEEEKKNSDASKIKEYEQSYTEALDEFQNGILEIRDSIVKSTTDWADAMSSSIRSSFQNATNYMRDWAAQAKTMIGDVVENMLKMALIEPLLQDALQEWTHSDELRDKYTTEWTDDDGIKHSDFDSEGYQQELLDNIYDEDSAKTFYNSILSIAKTAGDTVENMPDFLKDAYAFNADTSALSGGIESMTEDTGRTLEGLGNSILMQHVMTNQKLEEIKIALPFAQVQVSWYQDMLLQSQAIALATKNLNNAIEEVRNGIRPLCVTM